MARPQAVLPDADQQAITNKFMRDESNIRRVMPGSKADQRSAVDSVDNWWAAREIGFLNSFPPVTNNYTDEQKMVILLAVLKQRSGV